MKKNKILTILLAFLFSSCGLLGLHEKSQDKATGPQLEQLRPRAPKTYSNQIEKEFSQIEHDSVQDIERQRAIEAYEQMRLEDRKKPQRIQERRRQMIRKERAKRRTKAPVQQKQQKKSPPPPQISEQREQRAKREIPKDLKIQGQQHIDYFCIKNEDRNHWGQFNSCQDFGKNLMGQCKEQFSNHQVSNLINCIKSELRT